VTERDLATRIAAVPNWYHRIELAPGVVTPGIHDDTVRNLQILNDLGLPPDCKGARVLDLGARDGFYTFEMERRGAEVVAVDYASREATGYDLVAEVFRSQARYIRANVYDLRVADLGAFDIVLCLGLLYHLRDPLLALDTLRPLCSHLFYLETQIIDAGVLMNDGTFPALNALSPALVDVPLMQYFPRDVLSHDITNHWAPNMTCMRALLSDADFASHGDWQEGNRGVFAATVGADDAARYKRQIARGLLG